MKELKGARKFGTVMVFIAFLAAFTAFDASVSWALPVARLRNVKPTVQVRVARGKDFSAVSAKQALQYGDIVRTAKNGKAEVLFSNGTRVAMNGGAQIQIVAPESKTSPLVIRVFGAFSEVFVRPRGNTQVRTAAAIAAARGTAFLVRLPDENTAIVTVTEDEVDFYNDAGRVLLAAGQQSTATVGSAPTPPVTVDASGQLAWTAEIAGLPVEYETMLAPPDLPAAELRAAQNPNDITAQLQLGATHRAHGDAAGAESAYERALQIDPNNVDARLGLALTALSMQDTQRARAVLEPIGAEAQTNAVHGLIELQRGEYGLAAQQLETAVGKNPNLYQAHALLALARLSQNQIEPAQQSARRAVKLEPRSAQTQSTLAMVLFFSGREFQREAERAASRAVASNPDSPMALLVQGRVLLLQREPDEAAAAFAQAAALMPQLEVAQREWGSSLLLQDKPQSAEKAYRRALAINPDSVEAQTGLGVALLRQGNITQAQTVQQRALEMDANNATVRANYAALLIEDGKLDQARAQLDAGIIAAPDRGVLYARLSEVSLFQQRPVDAQEFARRAVALIPDSALAHYQVGRVHLELERYSQAAQAFRKAVLLDRDFAEARYALGFARELVETGRDPSRPTAAAGAGALNSAARALNIQNLQTPGAEDRLQAAVQDPVVVRTATRSYGDTEIKLSAGEDGWRNGEISHLRLHSNRRGVLGVTAQRQSLDDLNGRDNSDFSTSRFGLIYGQKAQDNPSGIFAIAQYERLREGLNRGDLPAVTAPSRSEANKPRILIGGNWQRSDDRRTRALFQYVQPERHLVNPLFGDTQDDEVSSYNGELRHDRRFGRRHYASAGIFAGKRKRELNLLLAGFPPFFPDQRTSTKIDVSVYGGYVRDEYQASEKLRLVGELKLQSLKLENSLQFIEPVLVSPNSQTTAKTALLPTFIAEYQVGVNTGVRLRLNRTVGGVRDFELLSPTETFLSPANTMVLLSSTGTGTKFELEGDHTFQNGSFIRFGVFQHNFEGALEPTADGSGNVVASARIQGVRLGYEGNLNQNISFFLNGGYTRARDRDAGQDLANVPQWTTEAGLQYLNNDGWFAQPSWFYQGSRLRADRSSADSFGIVRLRIGKRFGLRGTAFVEVHNLFDKSYDILEVEQPGRQFRVGVIGRF